MELFRRRAQIISQAVVLPGDIALSSLDEPRHNVSVLISMAADSLLDIRGVRASIVLGIDMDMRIRISARSLGDLNVQRMMEKLGGGGHLTMAGAQLDIPMEEAIERVKAVAAETVEDENKKAQERQSAEKKSETKRLQMQNTDRKSETKRLQIQPDIKTDDKAH